MFEVFERIEGVIGGEIASLSKNGASFDAESVFGEAVAVLGTAVRAKADKKPHKIEKTADFGGFQP